MCGCGMCCLIVRTCRTWAPHINPAGTDLCRWRTIGRSYWACPTQFLLCGHSVDPWKLRPPFTTRTLLVPEWTGEKGPFNYQSCCGGSISHGLRYWAVVKPLLVAQKEFIPKLTCDVTWDICEGKEARSFKTSEKNTSATSCLSSLVQKCHFYQQSTFIIAFINQFLEDARCDPAQWRSWPGPSVCATGDCYGWTKVVRAP